LTFPILSRKLSCLPLFYSKKKIAAKNAKTREEKEKKSLAPWCLGGKVFEARKSGRKDKMMNDE